MVLVALLPLEELPPVVQLLRRKQRRKRRKKKRKSLTRIWASVCSIKRIEEETICFYR